MADRRNIQPLIPSAPKDYAQRHQDEVQRAIDVLYGMIQNPGELRGTDLTLTDLQSGSDAGLETGALFEIGGVVHIAPFNTYLAKTNDYTITTSDFLIECTTGTFTVTLPTAVGVAGRQYEIKNSGTGVITVDAYAAQTIDGQLTQLLNQYDAMKIMSNSANWIII